MADSKFKILLGVIRQEMGFCVPRHMGLWINLNSNHPSLGFLDFIQDTTLDNFAECVLIS